MTPRHRPLMLLAALVGLLLGGTLPQLAPGTLAYQHDAEHGFARFQADVPLGGGCAVWANGTHADSVGVHGRGHRVGGCLHSNGGVVLTGSRHVVEGTVRHAGPLDVRGEHHRLLGGEVTTTPAPYPYEFRTADYAPGGPAARRAAAEQQYFVHVGSVRLAPPLLQEGLHYVEGRVTMHAGQFEGNVTVVATGPVDIRGAGTLRPFVDGLLVHSSSDADAAITVLAEGGRLEGALVALEGGLRITGHDTRVHGQLVADRLTLAGSGHELLPRTPRPSAPAAAEVPSDPGKPGPQSSSPTEAGDRAGVVPGDAPARSAGAALEQALAAGGTREALRALPVSLSYGDFDGDGRNEFAFGADLGEGGGILLVADPDRPVILLP